MHVPEIESAEPASARAINARAYTIGPDVAFARGEYAPASTNGRRLLAHELTHVVQQGSGTAQRSPSPRSGYPAAQSAAHTHSIPSVVQRLTDPLSNMSTFQAPVGGTGWHGAIWGCYRTSCTKRHKGWDINAASGTECSAVVAGTTVQDSEGPGVGYGDYVVLTSSADATKKYYYAHLGAREPAGVVAAGAKIGATGVTGNASATRPHLHFTLKESNVKVDPVGKGFTKPTKVIEAAGTAATSISAADPAPCSSPCAM